METFEVDDPRPLADHEVLIDTRGAGVGNWDNIIRYGGWDVGTRPPLALGVEAAGVIKAVGNSPGGFGVGDEVLCHPVPLREQGTWAPLLIAPAGSLAHKPPEIPWPTAAIFPVPALTAEQVVGEALALCGGETLLVHGAGGITGGLIVQLAALRGVDVLATAGPRSADRVRGHGAREVIDYRDPLWPRHATALAKDSIDAVANAAPGGAGAAMTALADGGRLATITPDPPAPTRGISVTAVYVRSDGAQLDRLTALLASRRLSMPTPRCCGLDQAAAALAHVVAGHEASGVAITKAISPS
ncbi:NADP-dependent oxidoreductase [Mycobacterium intracellulare]|uniref:NADP-dependent oxidoreductase n=1 Tax=Mycobacterium intracellulare TaxID=1767 RepID=A0AAE4RAB7_MYCIT|nr:NADP-dependent oxidoreductase [Mycobacterium intracellulare]MDV6978038.1 NADP-dependent oxidoreductase [Mycobacterium intracellulare]MDV6983452.1 NADP-dependent oxidoreductase [Mycobacterium intracellulare]MDV7012184.1 NADP-dependent oxidoreductase [Mycobacterium intracellulare]MDV7027121.1 NADP-dependent oxidoreductase [Mycobacterium intracellulare]